MNSKLFRKCLSILTSIAVCVSASYVIDSTFKGLRVSDYCPFMKGCAKPGIHVMCTKNPNIISWFGPHCHEAKNITVTDQIALRLLTIINAIRRKVALGLEKGSDEKLLPRGYGIFKLNWDSELATFAQLWANQCLFHRDFCRSTRRFPSPSQSLGLVRFTYPDWKPISSDWPMSGGFQPKIIVHSVVQTVKKWYTSKSSIPREDMFNIPQSSTNKPYLNMISGDVTHMGCGISAFTEYSYNTEKVDLLYNSVLLVCNFSKRLEAGKAVYNTSAAKDTSKCGCPPYTQEDEDCLCSPKIANPKCKRGQCNKPSVVLLPIFTVEDPPISKIENLTRNRDISTDMFEEYEKEAERDVQNEMYQMQVQNRKHNSEVSQTNSNSHSLVGDNDKYSELGDIKTIIDNYLKYKHIQKKNQFRAESNNKPSIAGDKNDKLESVLTQIADEYILPHNFDGKYNQYVRNTFSIDHFNESLTEPAHYDNGNYIKTRRKYADNKLIILLDTLEREVSQIEIQSSEKEILDAKIRKIYGDIMKKTNREIINSDQMDKRNGNLRQSSMNHNQSSLNNYRSDLKKMKYDDVMTYPDTEEYLNNNYNKKEMVPQQNGFHDIQTNDYLREHDLHNDYDRHFSFRNYDVHEQRKPHDKYVDSDELQRKRVPSIQSDKTYPHHRDAENKPHDTENRKRDMIHSETELNHRPRSMKENGHQLDIRRRKYYQDKLDKLESHVYDVDSLRHKNRHILDENVLRPTINEVPIPSKKRTVEDAYLPSRARTLHGY